MKLPKTFTETIKTIKSVLIIFGLPTILYYAYQIHLEQLKAKDLQIEILKARVESLQDGQVNVIWDKYKSLKEFSEAEMEDLNNKLNKTTTLNDSLKKYIAGPILVDKNRISLTEKQAKGIIIDLIEGDRDKELLKLSNQMENALNDIIKEKDKMIRVQKSIISNQSKIIKLSKN